MKPAEIGQSRNGETLLDCEVTANPIEVDDLYWEHEGKKLSINATSATDNYYNVELFRQTQPYTVIMALRITAINDLAFGTYHCRVSNKYGSASASSNVYEIKRSTARQPAKIYPTYNENTFVTMYVTFVSW